MMRRQFISVAMGIILLLVLAGGADAPGLWAADSKPLPSAVPVGSSGGPLARPLPVALPPPVPTYEYSAARKADPFRPFMETDPPLKAKMEEELKKLMAKRSGPISPLQQADIGRFRLVGTAGDQKRCVAVVEDGISKKYYPLVIGTYIGLNRGRVSEILPDRVIVEEKAGKQAKKEKVRRVTLMLHKEKEEEEGKP